MTEWCASCGKDFDSLNEVTGWCAGCTLSHYKDTTEDGDELLCSSCGRFFRRSGQFRDTCPSCRETDWQARNADLIERWMGAGLPYALAKQRVMEDNRPSCLGCGRKIKRGTRGRHFFCRASARCTKLARRYKYLKEHYLLSREEAIERTLAIQREQDLIEARKQQLQQQATAA